jgi:hypothetical protein
LALPGFNCVDPLSEQPKEKSGRTGRNECAEERSTGSDAYLLERFQVLPDAKVFEGEGIRPLGLFLGALPPTAAAILFFWLLH